MPGGGLGWGRRVERVGRGSGGGGGGARTPSSCERTARADKIHSFSCCLGCRPGLEHRARCFTRLTPSCPGRGIGRDRSDPRNELERGAEF